VARLLLSTGLIALALLVTACDRGSRPEQIGQKAPDFTVTEGSRSVSLHDYRGRIVVLNFWATWCPPCVQEMPSLTRMQQELGDAVTVLAVSTDQDQHAYEQFLSDRHITLLTIRDEQQRSNHAYGTERFPETYVIDKKGTIRRKFIGEVKWTSPEIEKYLRQLASE
jgi:cytochrome c biogenesis protein CcmG, thiol:disulfide interchange protein DsbE